MARIPTRFMSNHFYQNEFCHNVARYYYTFRFKNQNKINPSKKKRRKKKKKKKPLITLWLVNITWHCYIELQCRSSATYLTYFLVIGPLHMSNLPLMATYSCCISHVYPGLITTCHFLDTPLSHIVQLQWYCKQNYSPILNTLFYYFMTTIRVIIFVQLT